MRVVPAQVTGALVEAGLVAPAVPAVANDPGDHPGVRNVLPPGQSGSIDLLDAVGAEVGGTTPKNFADQLEMYDGLTGLRA